MTPIPTGGPLHLLQVFADVSTPAEQISAWASANTSCSDLKTACDVIWSTHEEMIKHADQTPVPKISNRVNKEMTEAEVEEIRVGQCLQRGVCLFHRPKKPLYRLANAYLGKMKPHFKRGTPDRKLLDDGFIVGPGHRLRMQAPLPVQQPPLLQERATCCWMTGCSTAASTSPRMSPPS